MSDRTGVAPPQQPWAETASPALARASSRRSARMGRRSRRSSIAFDDARSAVVGGAIGVSITGAMVLGSATLTLATSFVGLAASIVSPMVGLLVLAFVAPLPRPLIVPPPGIWVVMIAAIMVGLVLRLPIDRPRLRLPALEIVLAFAFLAYLGAHALGGALDDVAAAEGRGLVGALQSQTDLVTGLLILATASIVLRGRSPWPLVTALLVSTGIAAASGLLPAVGVEGLFENVMHRGPTGAEVRSAGFFFDPNYYAAFLGAAVALALACATFVRSLRIRLLLIVATALYSAALVLTLSRGGLLTLATAFVAVAFMRSLKTGLMVTATLVFVVVLAFPFFSDARFGPGSGIAEAGLSGQLEASGRIDVWLDGLDLFASSPVFGIGFGRFADESPTGLLAHNWYISVLAEGGIVGFVLWFLFIGAILLALRRTSHAARTVGYSVMATWLVASLFLEVPQEWRPTGLVVFSVAAALTADWTSKGYSLASGEAGRPIEKDRPLDVRRLPRPPVRSSGSRGGL